MGETGVSARGGTALTWTQVSMNVVSMRIYLWQNRYQFIRRNISNMDLGQYGCRGWKIGGYFHVWNRYQYRRNASNMDKRSVWVEGVGVLGGDCSVMVSPWNLKMSHGTLP